MKKFAVLTVVFWLLSAVAQGQWYQSPYTLSSAPALYRDADPITTVHECTHGVNSMLRNRYGQQCFYVGYKKFVRFPKTGVTLATVAANCRFKGKGYNIYLVESRQWWNDTGLYLFDEWVAYANSAAVAVYKRTPGQSWSRVASACEFGYYCYVLVQLVPDSYPMKKELEAFWRWHAQRVVNIADTAEKTNVHYHVSVRPWREWLRAKLKKA